MPLHITWGMGADFTGTGTSTGETTTGFRPAMLAGELIPQPQGDELEPGVSSEGERTPGATSEGENTPATLTDELRPVMIGSDEED